MGILVKNALLNNFTLNVLDKSCDGVLIVELHNIHTACCIILFVCYLPPMSSPWSNSTEFFAHIMGKIYEYADADFVLLVLAMILIMLKA